MDQPTIPATMMKVNTPGVSAKPTHCRVPILRSARSSVWAPVANAFAERWIGTLRRELLDRTLIWNQRQLERLIVDYMDHYKNHRPHPALEQRRPSGSAPLKPPNEPIPVVKTTRCNGLINEYRHAA